MDDNRIIETILLCYVGQAVRIFEIKFTISCSTPVSMFIFLYLIQRFDTSFVYFCLFMSILVFP